MSSGSDLDQALLTNSAAGAAAAAELRRQRGAGGEPGDEQRPEEQDGEPRSLRERWTAARNKLDLKKRAKQKLKEKVVAPVNAATSRGLQWAWKSLIMTWGLTILWIDAHGLLRMIFGKKLFCQYGEEWLPKQATDAAGEAGKMVKKSISLVEGMAVIFLNLILFFVLAALLSLFVNESMLKDIGQEAAQRQTPAAVVQPFE